MGTPALVAQTCQTQARGPNLSHGVIIFGPRDNFKMSIRVGAPIYSSCTANTCKSQNALLVRWGVNQDPPSVDVQATSYQTKLCMWESQMLQEKLGHFPCCQNIKEQISTDVFPSAVC